MQNPISEPVKKYLLEAPVCRIATVRPSGEPHLIPVCPVFDGGQTIYVDLGPKSVTASALRSEPRISVLVDDYHDDWTKLRKVLLRCVAEQVRGSEQDAAWDRIRQKFPQYLKIGWEPRLTMALRIRDWLAEGFPSQ
jgi:nitroimidazol reductase NimA-like FMN-containing flavoprotein (pyridoxamine 5'-phosphate oxidase superfamily)